MYFALFMYSYERSYPVLYFSFTHRSKFNFNRQMDPAEAMDTDINRAPEHPRPDIYHLEYNPQEVVMVVLLHRPLHFILYPTL